jgi:hypothetical protein
MEDLIKCEFCSKKFNSKKEVENHQLSIFLEEAQNTFCVLIYLVHKISSEIF